MLYLITLNTLLLLNSINYDITAYQINNYTNNIIKYDNIISIVNNTYQIDVNTKKNIHNETDVRLYMEKKINREVTYVTFIYVITYLIFILDDGNNQ